MADHDNANPHTAERMESRKDAKAQSVPNDLPRGWVWTTIGEIAELVGGGTPSRTKPEYFTGDIIWLTPTEIPKDHIAVVSDSKERITEEALRESSARLVPKGTVLMTSRASIGYIAIAGTDVTTNQGFASFICEDGIYNLYLAYWLWANTELFLRHATGTTFKEITKSKLRPLAFQLAPLSEQHRIVAEIEKQFTRLDTGIAALKRAQAGLKRYKAAVLKAACEGKLVPQDPDDKPASELLKDILAERPAKGKDPKKAKYIEPKGPDVTELPELPSNWVWATAEQLSDETRAITYGVIKLGDPVEDGIPTLRSSDVRHLRIELDHVKRIDPNIANKFKRTFLHGGEVLITVRGTLGGVAVVPNECRGFNISREVAMIALVRPDIGPLIPYFIGSEPIQNWLLQRAKGIAYTGINIETLKQAPVPLPPLSEQRRIVAEVERRLSVVQELEASITDNLARSERLRQSILKQAFEGRLVPQEPSDEPASMLLERIRANRAGTTETAVTRKRRQST